MNDKINQKLLNFEKALKRFNMALQTPLDSNHLIIEATIQCFEFSYELTWKVLKAVLLNEGIQTNTPKESFQEAYQAGWIKDESLWLSMLKDRNLTSHTYNEKVALQIYDHLKDYYNAMLQLHRLLMEKMQASK